MIALIVINPFGGKQVGDRITDEDTVEEILAGGNVHNVVQADHKIALANSPKSNIKKES